MVKEIHDLAGQHEVIAENLQSVVSKDLQTLILELKQERKKVSSSCMHPASYHPPPLLCAHILSTQCSTEQDLEAPTSFTARFSLSTPLSSR